MAIIIDELFLLLVSDYKYFKHTTRANHTVALQMLVGPIAIESGLNIKST